MDYELLQAAIVVTAATFIVLYPQDSFNLALAIPLSVKTFCFNYFLMFRAWLLYRQLCRDFDSMGLPRPAFKFTPLWER